ncbi:MAG: hypothetical protein JW893_07010 [Candidatus Omnitrophica bacterium]|nr:hypothetical protein [Candidatus Omnitrophota bacterium]
MLTNLFQRKIFLYVICVFLISFHADAAQKSGGRDAQVDAALIGPGMAGVLPATGSQSMSQAVSSSGAGQFIDPGAVGRTSVKGVITMDQTDQWARVYQVNGNVKIASEGSDDWKKVKEGTVIQKGDVVVTNEGSSASITFDESLMNVTFIPENTRAVFRSIEPTDIYLEDGTIYNVFENLPKGSGWQVSNPVAVAAVRGTWYLVQYQASNGELITAVFDVPEDGQTSQVALIEVLEDGTEGSEVDIPEGFQIRWAAGDPLDSDLLEKIAPEWIQAIEGFLENLIEERKDNQGGLPPTGGEFLGAGNVGGGNSDNLLDPLLDTGAGREFEPNLGSGPEHVEEPESPYVEDEGCTHEGCISGILR